MIYNFAKETGKGCIFILWSSGGSDNQSIITSSSLPLLQPACTWQWLAWPQASADHCFRLAEPLPIQGVNHFSKVGGHELQTALLEDGGAVQVGNLQVGHHSEQREVRGEVLLAVLLQLFYLVLFFSGNGC